MKLSIHSLECSPVLAPSTARLISCPLLIRYCTSMEKNLRHRNKSRSMLIFAPTFHGKADCRTQKVRSYSMTKPLTSMLSVEHYLYSLSIRGFPINMEQLTHSYLYMQFINLNASLFPTG